ncbi:hypothetical protein CDAR_483201 [Caerostris darwini]|uniref:Uncharacterized protein n=1 Tax=Caerostris darwini TaxID=1538125 RepID=A0AAV4V470_9ARAC|nr:hypothetical protein CDAR_483201 [Caerostris darwini]
MEGQKFCERELQDALSLQDCLGSPEGLGSNGVSIEPNAFIILGTNESLWIDSLLMNGFLLECLGSCVTFKRRASAACSEEFRSKGGGRGGIIDSTCCHEHPPLCTFLHCVCVFHDHFKLKSSEIYNFHFRSYC